VLHKPLRGCEAASELRELALAALAWVDTCVDCHAVEWHLLDPISDHVRHG
jgi:hypothetical protein